MTRKGRLCGVGFNDLLMVIKSVSGSLTVDGTHVKVAVVLLSVRTRAVTSTVGWLRVVAASPSLPHSAATRHAAHTPGLP